VIGLVKVNVEVPQSDFEILTKIAKKVGVSVEKLISQEANESLTNAIAWIERAQL